MLPGHLRLEMPGPCRLDHFRGAHLRRHRNPTAAADNSQNADFCHSFVRPKADAASLFMRGSGAEEPATLPRPFDAEFGTDTGGMIYTEELRYGRGRRSVYRPIMARLLTAFQDRFLDSG